MSAEPERPIGVFDSGMGGLSVLKALQAELPLEQFVYVSDSGHAPYGERDDKHVLARSRSIANYLVAQHDIKALVMACNTATAAAVRQLRLDYPQLPIVGVEPALKPAVALSKTGQIGVMATRGTVNSEKFKLLLASLQDKAAFKVQACDGLADAIEQGDATKIGASSASNVWPTGPFGTQNGHTDVLVLGCTHYPFIEDEIRKWVGPDVVLLECGAPVARQTRRVLAERQLLRGLAKPGEMGATPLPTLRPLTAQFFTTGNAAKLQTGLQRWLQVHAVVTPVVIEVTRG